MPNPAGYDRITCSRIAVKRRRVGVYEIRAYKFFQKQMRLRMVIATIIHYCYFCINNKSAIWA